MFGWAKPVPVAAWKFRQPRQGMMVVAAAGPAMNFALAWLAGIAAHALDYMPPATADAVGEFLGDFILVNLVLGLFNLLPIPPLDGGRIVVGLLPEGIARVWARLERFGIVLVLLAVSLLPEAGRNFGFHFDPVHDGLDQVLPWAQHWVMVLSGNGRDS
jgi:Zn-dependent protease